MKKLITLLLVLCAGVMNVSAEAMTIYVENTKGWGTMYLHQWGSSYNTSWPGDKITSSQTIDGKTIYTVELKDGCTGFILNNGGDSGKTANLTASYTAGSYYYIAGDTNASYTLTEMTRYEYTFNITSPTTLNYIYLYQDGNLNGDWPGAALTNNGDGTYSYTHSSFKENIYTVIFNQGSGNPQTCNLWANNGTNNYYIAGLASTEVQTSTGTWGQGLKTNGYGYITTNSYSNLTIPEGLAYYATDNNDGTATAHSLTNPKSGVPMLIKGNANTIYNLPSAASGTTTENNAFIQGPDDYLASTTGEKYNYVLNGETWKAANGVWVDDEKCYLQLSTEATAGARVLVFEDEDVTAIKSIESNVSNAKTYFDLSGRRVAQPTKGLYIVNGKKVIIK